MRISFDYDGTLADHFDGSENDQKEKVLAKLRQLQSEGHAIYIVTKRYSPARAHLGLVNEHIDPLRLAAQLSIPGQNVVFTDRALKADRLHELGIDQHYDDCDVELEYFLDRHTNSSMNYVMVSRRPWQIVNARTLETSEG